MVLYLIVTNTFLVLFYLIYHFGYKKLTFFQWNRWYLVSSAGISVLIPLGIFMELPQSGFISQHNLTIQEYIPWPKFIHEPESQKLNSDTFTWYTSILLLYWLGVILFSIRLLVKIRHSKRILKNNPNSITASFLTKIAIHSDLDYPEVRRHEAIHTMQRHSYDIIFIEIIRAFVWFNPIIKFYTAEIKFLHECIADELSYQNKITYAELLIAHALKVNTSNLFHEFSNHHFLKRRIMMLFKVKSETAKKKNYAIVIPALIALIGSTLILNQSYANTPTSLLKALDVDLIFKQKNEKNQTQDEVLDSPEILAQPKNGLASILALLLDNVKNENKRSDIKIQFIVEKDGSLTNFKVNEGDESIGKKIITVLQESNSWLPAIQNGKPVRSLYTLPIKVNMNK